MAKRVRFTKNYDLRVSANVEKAFVAGQEETLTDAQVEEVLAAGAAELVADKTPAKRDKAEG